MGVTRRTLSSGWKCVQPSMGVAFLGQSVLGWLESCSGSRIGWQILSLPTMKTFSSTGQPLHCVDLPDIGSRVLHGLVLFSKSTMRNKPQWRCFDFRSINQEIYGSKITAISWRTEKPLIKAFEFPTVAFNESIIRAMCL